MIDTSQWQGRTAAIVRPPIAEVNRLAAELAGGGRDIVNLGQAVLGLAPPAAALERVRDYLDSEAVHGYSPDPGQAQVREAVARHLAARKGIAAGAEQVMLTCGANQAFVNALLTISQPGDEVVLLTPGYFDHGFAVTLAGCERREVPLRLDEGRFALDLDAVARAISERTRAVVLVSPGNPTGMVAPPDDVARLAELCRAHGLWLVSDETYDLLTFAPARHTSPAALGIHDRVLVVASFSKLFAVAAWRVGYLFGPAEVVTEAIKVQDALVVCAPVPSQQLALGALAQLDDWLGPARRALVERRDALLRGLAGCAALEPIPPQGSTFLMARLRGGGDDVAFCMELLRRAGVVTVPGSAFGAAGRGFVRLSFGNQPVEVIDEACRRLRGAC